MWNEKKSKFTKLIEVLTEHRFKIILNYQMIINTSHEGIQLNKIKRRNLI